MARVRSGSYRKSFFTSIEMQRLVQAIWPRLETMRKRWQEGELSDPELVAEFMLAIWSTARPQNWSNGRIRSTQDFVSEPMRTFAKVRLRGIPEIAQVLVLNWHRGGISLDLHFHIPDADAGLRNQCVGKRCVTLLLNSPREFIQGGEGRDSFSFALHDLIHAAHFYSNRHDFEKQVFFCRWMQVLSQKPEIVQLRRNAVFQQNFDYLISDMNTHWIHSIKCLKSILPGALENSCLKSLWETIGESDPELASIWSALNTPFETEEILLRADQILGNGLAAVLSDLERPKIFRRAAMPLEHFEYTS